MAFLAKGSNKMDLNILTAISPIDGRYRNQTQELAEYFSEFGLVKFRVQVEIEYFISLSELPLPQLKGLDSNVYPSLRRIYTDFSEADARRVKTIETRTNHDVKAVEYFIKEKFEELNLSQHKEFIHFGLTSQDINNTAIPLSLKHAIHDVFQVRLSHLTLLLEDKIDEWKDIPMLARTHGQPASPTRMGKELKVFYERIKQQLDLMDTLPYSAKFGGATGNFNAHWIAYPDIDWNQFAKGFVEEKLGLHRSYPTTQIEHYDHLAAIFDNIKRINTILIDFSRDIWHYISLDYFRQKIKENEVGSSAMPHKVNPIDFENAEGNLGVANAVLEHLSAKLPISRLQRDLTDSTVMRNIGVPMAHVLIALKSLEKGINKLEINKEKISADLEDNWVVVAEAIQTILRREGYPNPFETLKQLTRKQKKITSEEIAKFIDGLDIRPEVKNELKQITPFNYTGK